MRLQISITIIDACIRERPRALLVLKLHFQPSYLPAVSLMMHIKKRKGVDFIFFFMSSWCLISLSKVT